jgi:hypothetical protein
MRCTKFLLVRQIIIKVLAELGVHVDLEDDNHQDWRDGDCHLGGAETDLQTNGCIEGAIRHSEILLRRALTKDHETLHQKERK